MGEGRGGVEVPLEWESWPPALPSSGGAARYSLAGGRQREAEGGRGRQGEAGESNVDSPRIESV